MREASAGLTLPRHSARDWRASRRDRPRAAGPVVLAVCRALSLSPEALASGRRTRPLSDGRAVIAYVGRTRYRLSGAELASALGTSPPAVTRAERRGEQLLEARADLRRALGQLVN